MNKFLPLIVAVVLTIILTWPLMPNMASYYPDDGDYPLNGSVLWYGYDSIVTGRIFNQQEYFRGYQFYPQPYSLAFGNNPVASQIFFAPIYFVTSSLPFSVNFYVFLTFVLSFLSAFYLVNYFVKNQWAAMTGAFIFAFNAQSFARFPQHIDVLSKYFLPLLFLFFYQLLEKPKVKNAFLFWLFFTLNALTHTYYAIFSLIFLPIVSLPFLISHIRNKEWGYFVAHAKVSAVGLIFLPLLLYFNLPYLEFSQKEGAKRSISEAAYFSARINDYFAPAQSSFLYGGWVKSLDPHRSPKDPNTGIFNYEEHSLFIGILATILFFVGLKTFYQVKIVGKWFFYLLLIVPFALSFGPLLPFYYYLYQLLPILQGIRVPSRFELVFLIPFSLIAAFGVKRLFGKWPKSAIVITIIIFVILTLENFTLKSFDDKSLMLDRVKNLQGFDLKDKKTLHLPIFSITTEDFGKNTGYFNWVTKTKEKTFNGNTAYLPVDHLSLLEQMSVNLDQKDIERLIVLGVNYIILHRDLTNRNYPILHKGLIFSRAGIEIYDLAKLGLSPKNCSFEQDFEVQVDSDTDIETDKVIYFVALKNKSDCFLPGIYEDRYRKIDTIIDGQKRVVHLRLPIIINPLEEIVLSEGSGEVRVE